MLFIVEFWCIILSRELQEKPYVFISYAHANSDRVLPIIRAMQESGISIWFDEGIVAGSGEFNTADFPKPQSSLVAPQPSYIPPSNANKSEKNRTVAILLALSLGSLGIDYFYLGKKVMGILCILFCLTYIPTNLGVINAIRYLIMGEEKIQDKYGNAIPKQ